MAFKRRVSSKAPSIPAGCRPSAYNQAVLTSLGIAALDDLIGLPLGSTLLVQEDANSSYSDLLLRFFIAQGLCFDNHHVLVIGSRPGEIVDTLMAPDDAPVRVRRTESDDEGVSDKMKIAFRYANLPKVGESSKSAPSANEETYCSTFDLTRTFKLTAEQRARVHTVELRSDEQDETRVLAATDERIEALRSSTPACVVRVVVQSLAGPAWSNTEASAGRHRTLTRQTAFGFLMRLRHRLRNQNAVALVTTPSHLYRSSAAGHASIRRLEHAADAVLELVSFASLPDLATAYPHYSGLLSIRKLPALGTLVPPSTRLSVMRAGGDLAFRLKRRRFVIERLQIDPDPAPSKTAAASEKDDDRPMRVKLETDKLYEF